MLLATFKHISSKNADYSAAEAYLTFEHDEFTMKPTLDENGRLIPRQDYRISTLNCGDEDFAIACLRANLRYGKNQKREDVKSHHYIISFDPKDVPDHGLNVDLAQSLGEKFCKEHFPGHQAIVCTHPDGHNGSGNVHVHIVINSLRIEEVPFMPYMDRPCDTQPGMKHRCTNAAMEYFRAEVMEMCHDAGLYQIDLLNGSKTRVTEREYWAKKKGQLALDEENAVLAEQGLPVKQTKFETDKDKLREEIRMALSDAVSFEDFAEKLLRRGITVKESRGRLSYLTPDRTKAITARKLGDDFDKTAVFAAFVRNAKQVRTKTPLVHSAPTMQDFIKQQNSVSRMVDMELTNKKLVDRGARMIMEETGIEDYELARSLLLQHGKVRKAVEAYKAGLSGNDLAERLRENGIECEYCDEYYVTFLFSITSDEEDYDALADAMEKIIQPKILIRKDETPFVLPEKAMSIREATFSESEKIPVDNAKGRICAHNITHCPPCIPIVVAGEIIDENSINILKRYSICEINVVK